MLSFLITSAKLELPSIIVMADKPDEILPYFSHLNPGSFIFKIHICLSFFFFFFQHNNQFVDFMCKESLPLSNINSSLLFRLANMLLTTQLNIHFTNIFSAKEIYLL